MAGIAYIDTSGKDFSQGVEMRVLGRYRPDPQYAGKAYGLRQVNLCLLIPRSTTVMDRYSRFFPDPEC